MSGRTSAPCRCGCADARGAAAHAIVAALAQDDLDGAIALGLLSEHFDDGDDITCRRCTDACMQALRSAREARLRALAARERYRARNLRLQRRADERAVQRAAMPAPAPDRTTTVDTSSPAAPRPARPSAAAAALARAKAKAAQRGPT